MLRWETIKGVAERVLVAAAMYATGKGWIAPEAAAGYVALALGILQAIWGWYQNTPVSLLSATAALPQVEEVKLAPDQGDLAKAVPSAKVEVK